MENVPCVFITLKFLRIFLIVNSLPDQTVRDSAKEINSVTITHRKNESEIYRLQV